MVVVRYIISAFGCKLHSVFGVSQHFGKHWIAIVIPTLKMTTAMFARSVV
jgi:hypothetical protein